jgi:6-pyruvoyltetrahydropterin/6-carboxytetrahydropterin synthase
MYRIARRFTFEAAHRLPVPPEHKCFRLHGHSYVVEVVLAGEVLDATGFVVDFAELDPAGAYLADVFDHRDLNEVLPVPSSEHLAQHLHAWCVAHLDLPDGVVVGVVRVSETRRSWAEYEAAR